VRSPPERVRIAAGAVAALALCLPAAGCGRANLRRGADVAQAPSRRAPRLQPPTPLPQAERVAVPLPLSARRATAFAGAVSLRQADLPGATPAPRSKTPPAEEREAGRCAGPTSGGVLGGGRSPNYQRGAGLDRESISSAVAVLRDAAAVREDLEYAASKGGINCYAKVLGRSILREQSSKVRLIGLSVHALRLPVGPHEMASGMRVSARVGLVGEPATVQLFLDALSLPYGPAELDLYCTSFVQPVPARTQGELLRLMLERSRLQRL
jgi:hypothetical protein